ncbi:hypothetical protein SALBM217S_05728 [Streptomyces griseoloalbus]
MWHRERPAGHARSWRTLLPEQPSRADSAPAVRARSASRSPPSPGSTPRSICWTVRCSRSTPFVPVAFGLLSPLPGAGRRRAGTVLRAVPAAAALITLGTYLAAATWSAASARCSWGSSWWSAPPSGPGRPGSSPLSSSATSWPASRRTRRGRCRTGSPDSPSARRRRSCANACCCRSPSGRVDPLLGRRRTRTRRARRAGAAAGRRRRPGDGRAAAGGGPGAAPVTDGARHPAHRGGGEGPCAGQAGYATRRFLDLLAVLAPQLRPPVDLPSAVLLRGLAAACADEAAALRGSRPAPGFERIEEMIERYAAARGVPPDPRASPSAAAPAVDAAGRRGVRRDGERGPRPDGRPAPADDRAAGRGVLGTPERPRPG